MDRKIVDYTIESDEHEFSVTSPDFPDELDDEGYGPDGGLRGIANCVRVRMQFGFQPFGSVQVTSHTSEDGVQIFTYHQAMVKYED
tara:strand:- start:14925 stop:15182 length:258 start_codon:yes stop_codon:yes gene_type:complete